MRRSIQNRVGIKWMVLIAGLMAASICVADDDDNIISKIVSAPVVTNGIAANEPTEINIILNARKSASRFDLDPRNKGYQIPAGGKMVIRLGGSYKRNPEFISSITNENKLAPNQNLIITTSPQNPIVSTKGVGVQHGNWSLLDDGKKTLTITPNGAGLENARANTIGVKVIHIRPHPRNARLTLDRAPFINGPAGTVGKIKVVILDVKGNQVHKGYAEVVFRKKPGPQVRITNAGLTTGRQGSPATVTAVLFESVHYQRVTAGTNLVNTLKVSPFPAGTPYAPRFLLFAGTRQQPDSFIPQNGIRNVGYVVVEDKKAYIVIDSNGNGAADKEDKKIGKIKLRVPKNSQGAAILPNSSLTTLGGNGSVFNVPIKVGDKKGAYKLKLKLEHGGAASTVIFVE